jgi:phage FluMu protein gp41
MARIDIALSGDTEIGGKTAVRAVLRELTPGDLIDAGSDAEKCMLGPDGEYHLVVSPTLSGVHLLRRQIVKLIDADGAAVIDGPLDLDMFFKLNTADFLAMQQAAENLDKAGQKAMDRTVERGRGEPAS